MKNLAYLIIALAVSSCSLFQNQKNTFKVLHWNIKELETQNINKSNLQMKAVENIINSIGFDILSINEIQYDLKNVPNKNYKSSGTNAERFLSLVGRDPLEYAISFYPSNTGQRAYKSEDGYYTKMSRFTRMKADQDNFGLFPAQYSTALISGYPIKEEIILKDLKWVDFNKDIKLKKFRRSNGTKFSKKLELFDKGFSDVVIEVEGVDIHLISLHTVPAYHFGNRKTPNFERNRDQLRFLEWYLTGGTDIPVKLPKEYEHIKPLDKDDIFIAMGDFNTSIYENHEGSVVLRRLIKLAKSWIDQPSHTHEQSHFGTDRLKLTLDYILYRGINLVDSGIYFPKEDEGVCIKYSKIPNNLKSKKEKIDKDKCINEKSIELKQASDHFPIWAEFKF